MGSATKLAENGICDGTSPYSRSDRSGSLESGIGRPRLRSSLKDEDISTNSIELPEIPNTGNKVAAYFNEHNMHLDVEDDIDEIPDEPPGAYISFKTLLAYLGPVS